MLDEITSKTVHKDKEGIVKYLKVVNLFKKANKNPQSFLKISPMQNEVFQMKGR